MRECGWNPNECPTSLPAFWFACRDRFPQLSSIALRYLSVPTNSLDAERSISQYTSANVPQHQSLSADNLANQELKVNVAVDSRRTIIICYILSV